MKYNNKKNYNPAHCKRSRTSFKTVSELDILLFEYVKR